MLGKAIVFVFRLHRECVRVEPVHQRLIEAKANVRNLRCMDVCIDEAGDQKLRIRELNLVEIAFEIISLLPCSVIRLRSNTNNLDKQNMFSSYVYNDKD